MAANSPKKEKMKRRVRRIERQHHATALSAVVLIQFLENCRLPTA
jgi:hypothetical protein